MLYGYYEILYSQNPFREHFIRESVLNGRYLEKFQESLRPHVTSFSS